MKRIFNYILILSAGLAGASCQQNSKNAMVTPHSEKVLALPAGDVVYNGYEFVFENQDVFAEYLRKIAADPKLKASIETKYASVLLAGQLKNTTFEKAYLFSTLSSSDYAAVNKYGRMTIGDFSIRFDSAYQYLVSAKESNLLNFIDDKIMDTKVVKKKYGIERMEGSNLRFSNLNGAAGKTNQQSPIFYYAANDPYPGQPTKYVNEVVAQFYMINLNPGNNTKRSLLLLHKLEYISGSGNVYPAGQARDVVDNFTVDGNLYWNNGNLPTFNNVINVGHYGITSQVSVTLHDYFTPPNGGNGFWNFEINGTINSKVISPNGHNYAWNKSGLIW